MYHRLFAGLPSAKTLHKVLKLHNKAQDRDSGTVSLCGVHPPILGQPTIQGGIKIFCGYLAGTMGLASIKKAAIVDL